MFKNFKVIIMKRRITQKRKKVNRNYLKRAIFLVLILIGGLLVFILRTKYWNNHGKTAVVGDRGGDVVISLFDSKADSQTEVIIPGETQVLAAYNLGTWKLKSLWKLGKDEKIGDSLMTRSISMNFGFPVFISWDGLSAGDKIRIILFSLFHRNRKDVIYLKDTNYLKKTVFLDGENGYLISNNIPEEISSLFSDQEEFGSLLKAKIIDSTDSYLVANKIGKIIQTMGIKVASISKGQDFKSDCKIIGKNKELVKKVSLVLGCRQTEIKDSISFDLEIYLGRY